MKVMCREMGELYEFYQSPSDTFYTNEENTQTMETNSDGGTLIRRNSVSNDDLQEI